MRVEICTFDEEIRIPAVEPERNYEEIGGLLQKMRFEADERQLQVLTSGARRGILNCCRQWGKSSVAAAMALIRAYSRPRSLVLAVSPTQRQSAEFLRKAETFARNLDLPVRGDGYHEASLELPNGSRLLGLPATETVRGYSAVSLMLIDETAWVPDSTYKALRPMLAVGGGDLWLMSTPFGRRGFFYENWEIGGDEWLRVSVPATECARIPASFLEEERRQLGNVTFAQEYLCEFTDNGVSLFDHALVEAALVNESGLELG